MFALGKILKISDCGKYAAIRHMDHVDGCRRTVSVDRGDDVEQACREVFYQATRGGGLDYSSARSDGKGIIAVAVDRYKELKPLWFVTEDELMAKYELAQQDRKVDIDPELLPHAKRIWSERLKKLSNESATKDQMKMPSVLLSNELNDNDGVPVLNSLESD